MTTTALRHWYRCSSCLTGFAVDAGSPVLSSHAPDALALSLVCSVCGGTGASYMGAQADHSRRLTHTETRCACDARCTGAVGKVCECACGGINHGTGRVVEVTIDDGAAPIGALRMSPKARTNAKARAAEWAAALELAGPILTAIRARRAAGEWLPRDQWLALRSASDARTAKTHAARLRRLAPVFDLGAEATAAPVPRPTRPAETHVQVPVDGERIDVEGEIVSVKLDEWDRQKMTVKISTDAGTWLCWGTCPDSLPAIPLRGCTVAFSATVVRGDRDEHFGFFQRPTKARLVSAPA